MFPEVRRPGKVFFAVVMSGAHVLVLGGILDHVFGDDRFFIGM